MNQNFKNTFLAGVFAYLWTMGNLKNKMNIEYTNTAMLQPWSSSSATCISRVIYAWLLRPYQPRMKVRICMPRSEANVHRNEKRGSKLINTNEIEKCTQEHSISSGIYESTCHKWWYRDGAILHEASRHPCIWFKRVKITGKAIQHWHNIYKQLLLLFISATVFIYIIHC